MVVYYSFALPVAMMTTAALLIGYYHGLLLKSIDADLLTDRMGSAGLLTAQEQIVISSGHSVYQKNWLLLEHVQYMDVHALVTFCELLQEIWPQIGSQLMLGVCIFDNVAAVCACVCVLLKALINTHLSLTLCDWLSKFYSFSLSVYYSCK